MTMAFESAPSSTSGLSYLRPDRSPVVDDTSLVTEQLKSLFNDVDADVTFCSADGNLFHLQRKYLEANTGAFPGSEFDTRGEVTHLTETSIVLNLLFQFVYPRREPEIENLEFDTLAALAEAAEKYEVFHAMNVCKLQMKSFISKYPLKVLEHSARHDYPTLIQDAVPNLVRLPMADVAEHLPSRYIIPWIRYRGLWDSFFDDAVKSAMELRIYSPTYNAKNFYFTGSLQPQICHFCLVSVLKTFQELRLLDSLAELKEALSKPRPRVMGCTSSACQYHNVITTACSDIKTRMENVPPFRTFMTAPKGKTPAL
ncbi:hypothetical protein GALMADRAFT_96381 [Galerina marginata CBS 339.88]|uniref:BTB domain-containing protein n=1 Tax=Galerina marginata (strain CBS 339.88) TaxID=685588 RepID=A0A067TCC9_GALM3|nr:hypothetical protein GALMADRAFT_96381 [Galerina marginata CBS 339.88]